MPDVLPATLVALFVACSSCCVLGTVGSWMPYYLSTEKHWSTQEYSAFYVCWGIVGFSAVWLAGWLARANRPKGRLHRDAVRRHSLKVNRATIYRALGLGAAGKPSGGCAGRRRTPGLLIGTAEPGGPAPAATGGTGGRTPPAAAGGIGRRPPGPAVGGCPGGGTKLGSIFGCMILVPPGPLNDTSRGVMLSIRQPLTASPSATLNGFSPFTAKIAIRRPGSVTIPVSLVSARSEIGLVGGRTLGWTPRAAEQRPGKYRRQQLINLRVLLTPRSRRGIGSSRCFGDCRIFRSS